MNRKALAAEFIGTFTLVGAVCGSMLFAAPAGGGLVGVALAAGLAIVAMAYAVGHVSGGHFNPAVTLGLVAGGRFNSADAIPYIVVQVIGGAAAAFVFAAIHSGAPAGVAKWSNFMAISNTFGATGQFSMASVFITEALLTALLVIVIMGATSRKAPVGFAPIAIGLALTLFYLVALPVSNASLNPARSTATALLAGGKAIADLWLFWAAPLIGGVIGGGLAKWLEAD